MEFDTTKYQQATLARDKHSARLEKEWVEDMNRDVFKDLGQFYTCVPGPPGPGGPPLQRPWRRPVGADLAYWIGPSGDLIGGIKNGDASYEDYIHDDYLEENDLSYEEVFNLGYIRLSICVTPAAPSHLYKVPSAQWTSEVSARAKKTLGGFVKEANRIFYDVVIKSAGDNVRGVQKSYGMPVGGQHGFISVKSGETDYMGYWKV